MASRLIGQNERAQNWHVAHRYENVKIWILDLAAENAENKDKFVDLSILPSKLIRIEFKQKVPNTTKINHDTLFMHTNQQTT